MNAIITAPSHKVVSQSEWLRAHQEFLAKEKEYTRMGDELARQRRELPWTRVEKQYVFDAPQGKMSLADLFGDRSQLAIYHFMFGPDWTEGCPGCSYVMDHMNGAVEHLRARDVALVAVSRGPLEKLTAFKRRMGWRFRWVSSGGSDFNRDFGVSFAKDEIRQRREAVQLRHPRPVRRGESGPEPVLQRPQRRRVSHLLDVCPRTGTDVGDVRDPRPGAEGARRSRLAHADGLGASSRQIRTDLRGAGSCCHKTDGQ